MHFFRPLLLQEVAGDSLHFVIHNRKKPRFVRCHWDRERKSPKPIHFLRSSCNLADEFASGSDALNWEPKYLQVDFPESQGEHWHLSRWVVRFDFVPKHKRVGRHEFFHRLPVNNSIDTISIMSAGIFKVRWILKS